MSFAAAGPPLRSMLPVLLRLAEAGPYSRENVNPLSPKRSNRKIVALLNVPVRRDDWTQPRRLRSVCSDVLSKQC